MDKKAIIEALRDKPQLGRPDIKGIPRRVTDAVNRNIATLLGTPVDTVTNAINLGIAGVGTLGHKLGLVSTPPNVIENPIGGSEWFGQQMEQRGMVSPERNTYNEVMAGLLMPAATTRAAKTLFNVEQQAARNIAAPRTLNTPGYGGQRGAVGFVYPQQEALDIAQRNAAKPVSEGGLGLPPNNTAMDRAKAMGFDTDVYHGSPNFIDKGFKQFETGHKGISENETAKIGHWLTNSPETASNFAKMEKAGIAPVINPKTGDYYRWDDGDLMMFTYDKNGGVLPLKIRSSDFAEFKSSKGGDSFEQFMDYRDKYAKYTGGKSWQQRNINTNPKETNAQIIADIASQGKKGAAIKQTAYDATKGTKIDQYVVTDPTAIRSRFAAFDPAKINQSDLLGYADPRLLGLLGLGTAGGIGAYNYMQGK